MITKKENSHFLALTGIRCIAAYMVYIHHNSNIIKKKFGEIAYDFAKELHIGVTLFFVLSGFLITFRYFDFKNFNYKTYISNRITRIYPMYFILSTITFLVLSILHSNLNNNTIGVYLLNITFLKGFFKDFIFSGISQGWTLTVEETFYLLAPFLFFLIRKSKVYLYILPIFLVFFGLALVSIFHNLSFFGFFASLEFMFNGTFFGRCLEFFTGIGLAILIKKNTRNFKYLTGIGLVIIVACVCLLSVIKVHFNVEVGSMHPLGIIVNTVILPVFGISTFYYGLVTEDTFISKLLGNQFFVLLGKSSYVFYLIHVGLLANLLNKFISSQVCVFILLNIIAILIFQFIEDPFNKYLRYKLFKRKPILQ